MVIPRLGGEKTYTCGHKCVSQETLAVPCARLYFLSYFTLMPENPKRTLYPYLSPISPPENHASLQFPWLKLVKK